MTPRSLAPLAWLVLLSCGEPPQAATEPPRAPAAPAVTTPSSPAAATSPPAAASAPSSQPFACDGTPISAGAASYCLVKTRRPWTDAAADCARMHGRLAIVDDAAKNAAIVTAIGSPWGYGSGLWLGCSDAQKEGNWLCDGKPMRFTSWAPGQPDNLLALDDCLEWLADSGQWNDLSCDIKLGYVCRGSASLRCPGAGRRISAGATSFCARGDELLDWEGAGKACKAAGGKLATIATAEEGRALFEALELPSGVPSWRPDEGVWIGLSDAAQEGTFVWTSGAGARFTSWAPGQPDDSGGGEDCATLTLGDGKWFDANCGKALPYLCSPQ